MKNFYAIQLTTITGEKQTLQNYEGKVLLIVNTASQCGFTPQYKALQALYQKYQARGFSILAFPCNQFKQQESANEAEILQFCEHNYGVSFPLFCKIDVNGKNTHPLYQYLKEKQKGILGTQAIKWNFTKFLVNKKGEVLRRFAPSTPPQDIEKFIEAELLKQ